MMTDIVTRARVRAKMVEGQRAHADEIGLTSSLLNKLADEIERLRAEAGGFKLELGNLATVDDVREVTDDNRELKDEIVRAYKTAVNLLLVLMEKHFPGQKIEPLGDTVGVIHQIDNLTTALIRADEIERDETESRNEREL
jgi:hypothetical protein